MANKHWLWLLIVIGGPCFIVLIFLCACLMMQRRARNLGVLPERHYSFYVGGLILPPPAGDGPLSCRDPASTGSQTELIDYGTARAHASPSCSPLVDRAAAFDAPLLKN